MPEKFKVSCLKCGATNNYPSDAAGKKVVCGRCKNPLPVPGQVLEPIPEEAYNLINNSGIPILIDFYSPKCTPCMIMHPIVERLAERRKGEVMVIKLNVDKHPQIASGFGISAVPTFIILRKGHEIGRNAGAIAETDFSLWVASRT